MIRTSYRYLDVSKRQSELQKMKIEFAPCRHIPPAPRGVVWPEDQYQLEGAVCCFEKKFWRRSYFKTFLNNLL